MIQTAKTMPGEVPAGVGIPNGAQVEVRIAKDAPLGERIAQARKHLVDLINYAKFQGAKIQPDATAFVAMFVFLEEVLQRVEAMEEKNKTEEIVEP